MIGKMTEQTGFNLEHYLSTGIEAIIKDAVKATLKHPRESAFLLQYAVSARKAGIKRTAAEKRGEHIPPFLIASITGKCNLSCAGCYAQASAPSGLNELDVKVWERIFTEAKELGIAMILLAGGEPFLRPDVITAAAKHPEILFPIFTNGTVLHDRDYAMLGTYRNLVPVLSVEGDQGLTDARRGAGVYARLMDAMRKFDGMGLLFGASITVTSENIEHVTDDVFIDDLRRRGCKIVFYVEYVPVGSEALALTETSRAILDKRLVRLREKIMIFISFPGEEKDLGGCLAAGRGFFHIAANGDAEPCPFSPFSDTNLFHVPLKDALRSPLFTRLKNEGVLQKDHKGGCVLFEQKETVSGLLDR